MSDVHFLTSLKEFSSFFLYDGEKRPSMEYQPTGLIASWLNYQKIRSISFKRVITTFLVGSNAKNDIDYQTVNNFEIDLHNSNSTILHMFYDTQIEQTNVEKQKTTDSASISIPKGDFFSFLGQSGGMTFWCIFLHTMIMFLIESLWLGTQARQTSQYEQL